MNQVSAAKRMETIGRLKDIATGLNPITESFLYYLPSLFEQNILNPVAIDSYISFADEARSSRHFPMIEDALRVLNQIVDSHDGTFKRPSSATFFDNQYFKWSELGKMTDPVSLISHIVNRTVTVLNLGKK